MAKRTDNNQQTIINTFRQLGYKVQDCSGIGKGFPDLIISKTGENILVEVKADSGKLTIDQMKFISGWNAAVYICRTVDECIQLDQGALIPVYLTAEQTKLLLNLKM